MSSQRESKNPISAEALMKQLSEDPDYVLRMEAKEAARREALEQHARASAPLIAELKEAGFAVESLDELRHSGKPYKAAIPILIKWLPVVSDPSLIDSVARALSVPWAKPLAAKALITEFRSLSDAMSSVKWTIGNALSIVADDSVTDELLEIVQDRRHGKAREMVVVALGNVRDSRARDVLLRLLENDELCGYAIKALAKLNAMEALPKLKEFTRHPQAWVRKEAEKAVKKLSS